VGAHPNPCAECLASHGPESRIAAWLVALEQGRTETFLGEPKRFVDGKAVASYVGLIPSEHSSGGWQRLGGLSKQGNPLLRFLWCEAVAHAVRKDAICSVFIGTG
jgi:transposase